MMGRDKIRGYVLRCVAASAVTWITSVTCYAQNPGWFKGDTVFAASRVSRSGSVLTFAHFNYPRPQDARFVDFYGYHFLEIEGNENAIRKLHDGIKISRGHVCQKNEKHMLLVYDKQVPVLKLPLGLRLNEQWMVKLDLKQMDDRRSSLGQFRNYITEVPGKKAAILDWRYSTDYSGLPARCPERTDWKLPGELIREPVKLSADSVQVVILPAESIKGACLRKQGTKFAVASPNGSVFGVEFDQFERVKRVRIK